MRSIALTGCFFLALTFQLAHAEESISIQKIEEICKKTIEVMSNTEWDNNVKRFHLQPYFINNIDFSAMADQVYQNLQLDLEPLEHKRFVNLFQLDMIHKYWPVIKTYNETTAIVVGEEKTIRDEHAVIVPVIIKHDEKSVMIEPEIETKDGKTTITNIKINNAYIIDLATQEYRTIYQDKGWKGLRRELERRRKRI